MPDYVDSTTVSEALIGLLLHLIREVLAVDERRVKEVTICTNFYQ